jgi:hypothetical protein
MDLNNAMPTSNIRDEINTEYISHNSIFPKSISELNTLLGYERIESPYAKIFNKIFAGLIDSIEKSKEKLTEQLTHKLFNISHTATSKRELLTRIQAEATELLAENLESFLANLNLNQKASNDKTEFINFLSDFSEIIRKQRPDYDQLTKDSDPLSPLWDSLIFGMANSINRACAIFLVIPEVYARKNNGQLITPDDYTRLAKNAKNILMSLTNSSDDVFHFISQVLCLNLDYANDTQFSVFLQEQGRTTEANEQNPGFILAYGAATYKASCFEIDGMFLKIKNNVYQTTLEFFIELNEDNESQTTKNYRGCIAPTLISSLFDFSHSLATRILFPFAYDILGLVEEDQTPENDNISDTAEIELIETFDRVVLKNRM